MKEKNNDRKVGKKFCVNRRIKEKPPNTRKGGDI